MLFPICSYQWSMCRLGGLALYQSEISSSRRESRKKTESQNREEKKKRRYQARPKLEYDDALMQEAIPAVQQQKAKVAAAAAKCETTSAGDIGLVIKSASLPMQHYGDQPRPTDDSGQGHATQTKSYFPVAPTINQQPSCNTLWMK